MKYYTRHLGDYARNTSHLSVLEHGVYTLLIDRYYATEEPIPAKEVYRVCRASGRAERKAVDAILAEFFERRGEVYFNRRCHQEIVRYHEKSGKAKASAEHRWECERNANAMRTHSEGNAIRYPVSGIRNQEKESEAKNGPQERNPKADELDARVASIAQDHRIRR